MKITSINNLYNNQIYSNKNQNPNKKYISHDAKDTFTKSQTITANKFTFTGITRRLPYKIIWSTDDLISQWKNLKYAPYYEALDDKKFYQNKLIRKENFSFLDNVTEKIKQEFVEYFKKETSFPDLKKVSENIENEFVKQVKNSAEMVSPNINIVSAGYDPTCSVGLKKAFPGSDLDKAYVVLQNNSCMNSFEVINKFKSNLWFNTDQRILSLNNEDTFPEVLTMDGITYTLKKLDKVFKTMVFSQDSKDNFKYLRMNELDPVKGGLFNTLLAKKLPFEDISKEYAKNFAYFIESVRDGKNLIKNTKYCCELESAIANSPFAQYSNVTQMGAHDKLLSTGLKKIKTKMQRRTELLNEFDKFHVDEKYDLIKEIIKSVSKDNDNPKFNKYFQNDDDIKERYDRLNRLLLE